MATPASIAFGILIGFALGLTGGGGSIFAVPLLVYGLAMEPRSAVGVSLAAVGATALVGALERWHSGEVEPGPGLLFSFGGILGAPVGAWIGRHLPTPLLLLLFAALMLGVAARMWRRASVTPASLSCGDRRSICRRDAAGRLAFTSRCGFLLAAAGLGTGVLAGLFGVGGGFVIVPALVVCSGMTIHRAVATSLLAIALISASGVTSFLLAGQPLPLAVTLLFVAGGVVGMELGSRLGRRLAGPHLQRVFAGAILFVACFVVVRTLT